MGMTQKKPRASRARSVTTGRFWPCQSSGMPSIHGTPVHDQPIANAVQVGPAGIAFVHCGCKDHHFFTDRVNPQLVGYTAEQVRAMGYTPL